MNKINLTKDLRVDAVAEPEVKPEEEHDEIAATAKASETKPKPNLNDRVALRGDLIELHKRMVDMFTTLTKGLTEISTEKAAKDRAVLSARIDDMERSLNTMEGMVRIEMVPQFRAVLNEALEERDIGTSSRIGQRFMTLALIAGGVAAGVIWSVEIAALCTSFLEYSRDFLGLN